MAKKHYSIDQLSTATSRRAQSEAAMMQSELKKLRSSLLNMNRGIRAPKIKTKRTWTKKTTTSATIFGMGLNNIANLATEFLPGETNLSSAAQKASNSLALLNLAQRIR